jgi:hypothetical protein
MAHQHLKTQTTTPTYTIVEQQQQKATEDQQMQAPIEEQHAPVFKTQDINSLDDKNRQILLLPLSETQWPSLQPFICNPHEPVQD